MKEITPLDSVFEPFKGTLKKFNNSYFYINSDGNITKIDINFEEIKAEKMVENITSNNFLEKGNFDSISCDVSGNNTYYLCSYFLKGESYGISAFSNDLKLLYNNIEKGNFRESKDYFNKILYFKDYNKFITINSENDKTIRMRYFETNNKGLINRLKIEDINEPYLDIYDTQLNPYYSNNDIIVINTNSLLKIYVDENLYIFTKIQFYSNDTILTIKHLKINNYDKSNIINPRLAIWRNCFILASALSKNNDINIDFSTGFYIQGYPYIPKDEIINKYITDNNDIKINKFILENNIVFSNVYMYYKIISIPNDFIFINHLDNLELNNNSFLYYENDKISFRQYKKNAANISFIYQGVSITDLSYDKDTLKIYPKNEKLPPEVKIVGEGDKVELIINITSCNNGFYEVENKSDICTNVRPIGYYLDRKNKIFKKCHSNCSDCIEFSNDNSNMKCLKCVNNYVYDNKTFNCYDENNLKPYNIKLTAEKNTYFWVFLVIFFTSIFLILIIAFKIQIINMKNKLLKRKKDKLLNEVNDIIQNNESNYKEMNENTSN